jgi:c-di-GMP-binding flagellar brake protein YcgR
MNPKNENNRERRMATRYSASLGARVWLNVGWHQAICSDISSTGAGLWVHRNLEAGDNVQITLEDPDGDAFQIRAEIVHEGRFPQKRLGLRFVELAAHERLALQACMNKLAVARAV